MEGYKRFNREFFTQDTEVVAKELLGNYLIRETKQSRIIGKILEVEAYLGSNDKASHAYNFKKTERTKTMYMKPGTLYVYLIYGLYHCLNVVTEPEQMPCAVLIRQIYPIEGIELIIENRSVKSGKNFKNLVDGPGKLCLGLNITKEDFNGKNSCSIDSKLYFTYSKKITNKIVVAKKRIGVEYAEDDKDRLLRFTLINN